MLIYLATFAISIILFYIAEHLAKKHSKILILAAILIPCIISGLRDYNVGTDTSWYPLRIFNASQASNNIADFFNTTILDAPELGLSYKVSSFEYGFDIFVYLIQHITNNFHFLLFFIQLIINSLFYFGIKKYKNIKDNKLIWLSMLIFYFVFYNLSFNIIRQTIAVAFVFYGISALINDDNKKFLKCLISIIIASLFHKSGLLGIIIAAGYLLFNLLNSKRGKNKSNNNRAINLVLLSIAIFCLLALTVPSFLRNIISFISPSSTYLYYIGEQYSVSKSIVFSIPAILLFIYNYKNYKNNELYGFLTFDYILHMFCTQLTSDSMLYNGTRIGYFFLAFSLISIPILKESTSKKHHKQVITILIIVFCILYWYWKYIYKNYGETYPYLFFA